MRWLDYFGLPGVGKSTICDPLPKPAIDKGATYRAPEDWREFVSTVKELLPLTDWHPTGHIARAAIRTAINVTAGVYARPDSGVVVHRCFAHRGLSLACRMKDPAMARPFYRLMPISAGVVHFTAPLDVIRQRFRDRDQPSAVTPDDMLPALLIAVDELKRRTWLHEIDTTQPVENARRQLLKLGET